MRVTHPTDDDGPEAAFDRALRAAIREDATEARREAARRRLARAVLAYAEKQKAKGGGE